MTDFAEIMLPDGTSVRMELAPVGNAHDSVGNGLPGGVDGVSPIGRGNRAVAIATDTLRTVLRPLGPLIQEVHAAVSTAHDQPEEITVQFGVQIGQDLKLGIVGAGTQANLSVSATWRPSHRTD
ncbi:CU044_2847 family protein [Streptomyces sp. NPDC102360]|uniref:CU044_2847 family protein n=1 Tax=Streptomyces sp. NPDC102360 TaxID=3366160 RepID=UPI0037FAD7E3